MGIGNTLIDLIMVFLGCGGLVLFASASQNKTVFAQLVSKGKELYVSPQANTDGKGTKEEPLDLLTVLAGEGGVKPGYIVWLLPGTYPAPMKNGKRVALVAELKGTPEEPIILRAVPGERVILDGWLEVKGSHTWYWGFEIADSTYTDKTGKGVSGHGTSVTVYGPGTKFINLDVHDGAQGFGFWSPAVDAEIYGCIIHDFGHWASDRGHGHAIYTQNETGTKRIVDNIIFRGFGWNIHAYTQAGKITGFHIEGNICFSAGTRVKGQVTDNILVSGYPPADRITLINNYCYHPGGEEDKGARWRPCVRLDSYRGDINGSCTVKNNVIMGARGLQIGRWKDATISGNTIWGPEVIASVRPPDGDKFGNYIWDNNSYILTGQKSPFIIPGAKGFMEKYKGSDFEGWKAKSGFDANSMTIEGKEGHPTGTLIYVRPNKYEPGRAHIAVYNWDHHKSVEVDLRKVLKQGSRYRIYNVQNLYAKPVIAGKYDGKPVEIPMLMSEIAPDFDAFLVLSDFDSDE